MGAPAINPANHEVGQFPTAEAALETMADVYERYGDARPENRVICTLTIRYRLNGFRWTSKLTGYIWRTEHGRLVVKSRAGVDCGWPIHSSNVGRIEYATRRMRDLHGPLFVAPERPVVG